MKKFRINRSHTGALHKETKMEEAQGKKKRPLQDLRDKPITQERLAALLDVTPRAIHECAGAASYRHRPPPIRLHGLTARHWRLRYVRSGCLGRLSQYKSSEARCDPARSRRRARGLS